jgi:hypothetical protein
MAHRSCLRALMGIAALLGSWLAVGGSGSPALAAPIPYYWGYSISTPSSTGGCVGAVDWDPRPLLRTCDAFDQRQQWEFSASPSPGAPADYRQIRNSYYNLCIDARDSGGSVTGGVYLRDCNTSANQAWEFRGGWGGQGYACVWKAPNCDLKLEWHYPNVDIGGLPLGLADKHSHMRDHDIWYVWKNLPPRPWS